MSELEIPTEAIIAAARAAYVDLKIHSSAPIEAALDAATPIIVATVFRRYAADIEARASNASYTSTEEVVVALLDEAKHARDYANELDPSAAALAVLPDKPGPARP